MPGEIKKRTPPVGRRVFVAVAFVMGAVGSALMIYSSGALSNMPARLLCEQQGYPASDCASTNQTAFRTIGLTPPCCVGTPNKTHAWARPLFADQLQIFMEVKCADTALSERTQMSLKGIYSSNDLDVYEEMALNRCELAKMENKYYFLYQPGIIHAVATLLCAASHVAGHAWAAAIGTFVGTAASAITSSAVSIVQGLGWQTGVSCSDLPERLVSNGQYMDSFTCIDRTMGGLNAEDPGYAYLASAARMFYASAAMCVLSAAVYSGLLSARLARRHEQQSKKLVQTAVREPILGALIDHEER